MTTQEINSPSALVAIIVACRRSGDRTMERAARRQLEDRFGVKLSFAREAKQDKEHDGEDAK